ncbi:hypothetical protein K7W42_06235 [Deinococcus sp. HMF7604]|uniref:hypothetical protein n=1 Tax=Deinococcus betulae TaxID=2873312 RepID=UPI001CCEE3ED|nr:hypothetical protein [Deinococcus betulae]MBZ9750457.1 hypothetical protein [Deinococcus betulae]
MRPLPLALTLAASFALAGGAELPLPAGRVPAGFLVARQASPPVRVTALAPEREGFLTGLRVQAGSVSRTFPAWQTLSNPTFWPSVMTTDVTGDGVHELLITLMTDEGTGFAVYDARVLRLPDLREWSVTPPVPYLRAQVRFGPTTLTVGGREVRLPLPDDDFGPDPARIGDQVRWAVRSGHLTALVEVQKEWAFVGRLVLTYRAQNGQLVPAAVAYDPSELR